MNFIDISVYKYAIVIDVVYIFIHVMLTHDMGVCISSTSTGEDQNIFTSFYVFDQENNVRGITKIMKWKYKKYINVLLSYYYILEGLLFMSKTSLRIDDAIKGMLAFDL